MSDTFYVVSGMPGADNYSTAVAFNASHKDIDNKAAAEEYAEHMTETKPWQRHAVVTEAVFKEAADVSPETVSGDDKSEPEEH